MGDMTFTSQDWLYTAGTARSSGGGGHHWHPLTFSSNLLGLVSSSAPASYSGTTQLPRVHSYSGTSYMSPYNRSDQSSNYGLGLSEYNYDHHLSFSPSQYLPQGSDSQTSSSAYTEAESSRFGLGMGGASNSNYDFDVSGRYSISSSNSYNMNTSQIPAPTTRDTSPLFPTMHSLSNSLSSFPGRRVLPVPATTGSSNVEDGNSGNQGVFDDMPSFTSVQKDCTKRGIGELEIETETKSGIHGSTGMGSAENEALTNTASSKSSSSIASSENQENAYSYGPLSQSPPSRETLPAASGYSLTNPRGSGAGLDSQGYSTKSSYTNDLPNEILALSSLSSTSTYTHSSMAGSKYGSLSSQLEGGMLLSGQPYTQLRQPSSHSSHTSHSFESSLEPGRRPLHHKTSGDMDWFSTRNSLTSRR